MFSAKTKAIGDEYTARHGERAGVFGDKPYGNYGLWARKGMGIDDACDALTEAVAERAGMRAGDRVLEVGCGYGAATLHYIRKHEPSKVVGIDVSEVRLEEARRYLHENGVSDRVELRLGDAANLDFETASFDRVIAIECALHFDTREKFFHEAARVLVPGGGLGMSDLIMRRGADREEILRRVHFPAGSDGKLDIPENVYDADVYADLMRKAGLEKESVETVTDRTLLGFIEHLEGVARANLDGKGPRRMRIAQVFREYVALGMDYVLVSARKPSP